MLEGIAINALDIGAGGLVVLVVLLVLTGRLVTRGQLLDERAEKELWHENAVTQQEINRENSQTIANYSEAALIQKKVMRALQIRHGLSEEELESIEKAEDGSR